LFSFFIGCFIDGGKCVEKAKSCKEFDESSTKCENGQNGVVGGVIEVNNMFI
jgi:hypothetical protein